MIVPPANASPYIQYAQSQQNQVNLDSSFQKSSKGHNIQNQFGLNVEKMDFSSQMRQIDEFKKFSMEDIVTMSNDEKMLVIQLLQGRCQSMGESVTNKQSRIDELIRENTRWKNKIKDVKCDLCNNGEKIPLKVQQKIKKEQDEKDRKEKQKKQMAQR